jgi:hypothetical protein
MINKYCGFCLLKYDFYILHYIGENALKSIYSYSYKDWSPDMIEGYTLVVLDPVAFGVVFI